MDYRQLGRTGLELSRIGLGCGNFGGIGSAPDLFGRGESEEQAFALMDAAWAAGITFFDTAPSYGGGRSESWVGKWRNERGVPVLLSSKVYWSVTGDPDDRGLSRERILREAEGSLGRLGVDQLDLYLTHAPDPETPIEETLGALDELVSAGKVRAIGASNLDAQQLEEALETSERLGLARFEWVQNEFSLLEQRRRRRVGRLRAGGPRLHALQPARRRLADGQVPPRGGLPGRLADDACARSLTRSWRPRAPSTRSRPSRRRPPNVGSSRRRWRSPGCSATRE